VSTLHGTVVLDTTVLVYALGRDHPLREPCRDLVRAIGDGRISATTTVEVIQELAHVRARRTDRAEAALRAGEYAALLAPLIRPDLADLRRGMELFARVERLGAFDAVLAACALADDGHAGIVSADSAFGAVTGLTHLDPGAPDFRARLGLDTP
jgi:uncharacterized protein